MRGVPYVHADIGCEGVGGCMRVCGVYEGVQGVYKGCMRVYVQLDLILS